MIRLQAFINIYRFHSVNEFATKTFLNHFSNPLHAPFCMFGPIRYNMSIEIGCKYLIDRLCTSVPPLVGDRITSKRDLTIVLFCGLTRLVNG